MRHYSYVTAALLFSATTVVSFAQNNADSLKTVNLDEVVVSATRAGNKTPMAYSNINEQTIKSDNGAKNVPYILQTLPSMVAYSEDGSGVGNTSFRIRGTDATRINVTLNGMPLNNPESQEVYWVNLPDLSSSLQSIQVQRGVGTSTNGSGAFGASISLKTMDVRPESYGEASMTMGSYNTVASNMSAGTGLLKNGLSFDTRISRITGDGYIRNGSVDHKNIFLSGSYQTEKQLLKLNYINGIQHTGITWEGISAEQMEIDRKYNPTGEYYDEAGNIYYYGNETDNYYSNIAQLIYTRILSDYWTLNANLSYNNGYGYYENYKTDRKFSSKFGLENQIIDGVEYDRSDVIQQKLMDNNFYVANAMANYEKEKFSLTTGFMYSLYKGDHFGKLLWVKYNENIPQNFEWYNNDATKQEMTGFVKADYQITKILSVFGDIQYRHINYDFEGMDDDLTDIKDNNEFNFFNPKAGIYAKIDKHNEAYASLSMANREPLRTDLKESIKNGGTKTIKPEQMLDYEVGYKYNNKIISANLNLYYMDYNDQLVQTGKLNDVGYKLMENVANSYRTGIEIGLAVKPVKWLKWDGNITLSENKIKNYIAYYDLYDNSYDYNWLGQESESFKSTDISFSPNTVASSLLTLNATKDLSFNFMSKYVSEQYCDNTSNKDRSLDAYFVNNASVNYTFKANKDMDINLQFIVNNVFDEKYVANAWMATDHFADGSEIVYKGFYPQATRNFMGRLTVKF